MIRTIYQHIQTSVYGRFPQWYPASLLLALLLLFFLPAAHIQAAGGKTETLTEGSSGENDMLGIKIVTATDFHYISPSLTDNGPAFMKLIRNADGKITNYSDKIVHCFIMDMLEEKPDCVVLTGDLSFNGEKKSLEELAVSLRKLKNAGIPVLVLPGNHDLNNRMARGFSGIRMFPVDTCGAKEFAEIFASFGYSDALERCPDSLSYVYALHKDVEGTVKTVWLLCQDTNSADPAGSISEPTLRWTETVLKKAKEQNIPVISFTHQNLLGHNSLFRDGFQINNASRLIDLYKKYDVKLNMSGHMHLQHIEIQDGITDIATSCMTLYPCRFARLRIAADNTWTYQTADNGSASVYRAYALNFFRVSSSKKLSSSLENMGSIPRDMRDQMIRDITDVNLAYFSGRLDRIPGTSFDRILEEWQKYAGSSYSVLYLISLKPKDFLDMRTIRGTLQ